MMNNQEGPDAGDSYDEFQKKAAAFRGMDLSGTSKHKSEYDDKIGGIIINKGNATGQDILNLIKHIKSKVFEKYNIALEVEQRII